MRIAVTGASGRMGQSVIETAQKQGIKVSFGIDQQKEELEDVEIYEPEDFERLLAENQPDAVIDFTAPEATIEFLESCEKHQVPIVIGTTGFTDDQLQELEKTGSTAVLKASNFSKGILALRKAVKAAVSALPGYDIEVSETHHNQKVDAPSGTAKTILEDIEKERKTGERVHGREGDQPRKEDEIGVHARRAGDICGEHEILIAGNQEVVSLKHRSESREVFASGALEAAKWIKDRETGFYRFEDILG